MNSFKKKFKRKHKVNKYHQLFAWFKKHPKSKEIFDAMILYIKE